MIQRGEATRSDPMRSLQRLDARARRPCNLRRAANFTFNNHSNYDFLTRFKNPGIPSAFFDHEISFKYEKIPGRRAKLEDYQVSRKLLRAPSCDGNFLPGFLS